MDHRIAQKTLRLEANWEPPALGLAGFSRRGHKARSIFDRYNIIIIVTEGDLQEATKRLAGTMTGTVPIVDSVMQEGYKR